MSLEDNTVVLFTEIQRFRQGWIWYLVTGVPLLILVIIILNVTSQQSGTFNLDSLLVGFILAALMAYLVWYSSLEMTIDYKGLTYRFIPFHRSARHILWDDVATATVRKYHPIIEYGGWGIRRGFSGLAYNISGNIGLQLVLKNRRRILIGTQNPNELERVVQLLQKNGRIPSTTR